MSDSGKSSRSRGEGAGDGRWGPIVFFARHPVAANLLMIIFLVGGAINLTQTTQEVFPEVTPRIITVTVPYPGSSPEEVEDGVILAIESGVRGIDGVKEVRSSSAEGRGTVIIEWLDEVDLQRALNDVKNEVDRITSFPEQAEEPIISLPETKNQVLSVVIHGELSRRQLYQLAEDLRREMLNDTSVVQIDVADLPPPEISIEIPQENLRRFGLSLPELARRIDASSLELPAGGIDTDSGELRLRVMEEREYAPAFGRAAVVSLPDGSRATLADLGATLDTFRNSDERAFFEGQPAVRLKVYRVGDQSPVDISREVRDFLDEKRAELPAAVRLAAWNDRSQLYENRVGLLLENAAYGILLVLGIIGLFLRPRVAFWVTLGIPISFLGAFLMIPALGVSINMLSLFAFLLVLGIVVDDAIVIGEAIHAQRNSEKDGVSAAITGAREVAMPVVFAVCTTLIAFSPMFFVPGVTGQFFETIPLIVFPILFISLIESIFILPAHLAHALDKDRKKKGFHTKARISPLRKLGNLQKSFSDSFDRKVNDLLPKVIDRALKFRYFTLAVAFLLLSLAIGYVAGGRINFTFLPDIEADQISVDIEMVEGTAVHQTRAVMETVIKSAEAVLEEHGGQSISEGLYATVGKSLDANPDPASFGAQRSGSHLASVSLFLASADRRKVGSEAFAGEWREKVGELPGVERMDFAYTAGPPDGAPVSVQLTHPDLDKLRSAAVELGNRLEDYDGVFDIDNGFTRGKEQIDYTLRPNARALGLTETSLALQLRAAIFGAEAERQQRGRDELRIYVRLPDEERRSEYLIENLVLRSPGGGGIPLSEAAFAERSFSSTTIKRRDGQRVAAVTADTDETIVSGRKVTRELISRHIPELQEKYPDLGYFLGGERQDQQEATAALTRGMAIALLVMFTVMAVLFNSYAQPVLILFIIPFGFIGALLGHLLLGFQISIISLFGLIALSGVVVNDSLVLVAAVNERRRKQGMDLKEALQDAALRRFRPVLLTSLTTFFGLAPMIFETAVQARFLIPMALSLGFGVLFVTPITILLLPGTYHILEDLKMLVIRFLR